MIHRILTLAIAIVLTGCANRLSTTVSPEYKGRITPVTSIGLTGEGSSAAMPAFTRRGYIVRDLSAGSSVKAPFLATVEKVGTDGSWWDGFFDYSMRVTDTANGSIVWSATGEYGQGGFFINQVKSTESAFTDMVNDFSKNFPPKRLN